MGDSTLETIRQPESGRTETADPVRERSIPLVPVLSFVAVWLGGSSLLPGGWGWCWP
jgi:hypothetical protein